MKESPCCWQRDAVSRWDIFTTLSAGFPEACLPLKASHGQVKRSRLARESRATHPRVIWLLWEEEAWALLFRVKASSVSPGADQVTEGMVPLGSLTPCDANTSMQRQGIKHPITPRAPSVGSSVGNTKSAPQFRNEHGWLHTSDSSKAFCVGEARSSCRFHAARSICPTKVFLALR